MFDEHRGCYFKHEQKEIKLPQDILDKKKLMKKLITDVTKIPDFRKKLSKQQHRTGNGGQSDFDGKRGDIAMIKFDRHKEMFLQKMQDELEGKTLPQLIERIAALREEYKRQRDQPVYRINEFYARNPDATEEDYIKFLNKEKGSTEFEVKAEKKIVDVEEELKKKPELSKLESEAEEPLTKEEIEELKNLAGNLEEKQIKDETDDNKSEKSTAPTVQKAKTSQAQEEKKRDDNDDNEQEIDDEATTVVLDENQKTTLSKLPIINFEAASSELKQEYGDKIRAAALELYQRIAGIKYNSKKIKTTPYSDFVRKQADKDAQENRDLYPLKSGKDGALNPMQNGTKSVVFIDRHLVMIIGFLEQYKKAIPTYAEDLNRAKQLRTKIKEIKERGATNFNFLGKGRGTKDSAGGTTNAGLNKFMTKILSTKKYNQYKRSFLGIFQQHDSSLENKLKQLKASDKVVFWIQNTNDFDHRYDEKDDHHWYAVFMDLHHHNMNVFDSSGYLDEEQKSQLKKYIDIVKPEFYMKLKTNKNDIQGSSNLCGHYALLFLMRMMSSDGDFTYSSMRDMSRAQGKKIINEHFTLI